MAAASLTKRTSPLLLLAVAAFEGACARAPGPIPAHPNPDGLTLRQLAADMDDPAAAPVWPTVPPDLRALVAARIPASLSPAERRRLGETWVEAPYVTESCDGRDPQEPFLSFVAGWALLEDLAWSATTDQHVAAASALYDRLRKEPFTGFVPLFKAQVKTLDAVFKGRSKGVREFEQALCLGPVREQIAGRTVALERHLGAELLRGAPPDMAARVLRDEAARRTEGGDFPRAVPFAAAAARLLPRTIDAWLDLAEVSYQTDDVARGDDALRQALGLGADGKSEQVRKVMRFQTFAHQPPPKTFEQSLSRFWALFEMRRVNEARALIDQLRRQRPHDARALLGDVWLNYQVAFGVKGSFLDLAHTSLLALSEASNLTDRGPDYDRTHLSLAFQEALGSFMGAIDTNRPIASDPVFLAGLDRARRLSRQLAPSIPGDAALYALSLDVLETTVRDDGAPRDAERKLGPLFPRALALYTAFPSTESYRLVLGLSMYTDDGSAAAAVIVAPLRFDPGDDEQLAMFRVRAFVSAAGRAKDGGQWPKVSSLLAAVPPSSDATSNALDLLRADVEMLRAAHGEQTFWRSAWKHYNEISWTVPAFEQGRATNNVLAISDAFHPEVDTSANWSRLRAVDTPDWAALVNGAAEAFRAGRREEAIAILKSRSPKSDEPMPDFVADWLACLQGAPAKQAVQPPAGGEAPAVEVVYDPNDSSFWNFTAGLSFPPSKPSLQFLASDKSPWLIAPARLCWNGGVSGGGARRATR